MTISCTLNCGKNAVLKRPKTGLALCKECFFSAFEEEIHDTIKKSELFKPGEYIAIAASGGKDSTVLAYILKLLNDRYNYGLRLVLLSIDEGITGYRDDSLATVKKNKGDFGVNLKILSYKELYNWSMDEIVKEIGKKNNCTFCGVFRRQALDRGAMMLGVDKIATGHNADDIAETVLMNVLRGDIARLQRCTAITTVCHNVEKNLFTYVALLKFFLCLDTQSGIKGSKGLIPRCKPLKYAYEKEIVMYAYFKHLHYFSTECIFAPNAYRGHVRTFLKDLEKIRPTAVIDIIHSGETLCLKKGVKLPEQGSCSRCGFVSSQFICKACTLLEALNKGLPKVAIGKTSRTNRILGELHNQFDS